MNNNRIQYKEKATKDSYSSSIYEGGQFIGNVKLVPLPRNIKRDLPQEHHDKLYLADIFVKQEYRKRGLGNSLLEKVIDFSEQNKKPILLVAHPKGINKMSQDKIDSFYLKRGFQKLSILKHCFGYIPSSLKNS